MKRSKLRIAWSVAWGTVTILSIALWVRSYWKQDLLQCGGGRALASNLGAVHTAVLSVGPVLEKRWILTAEPLPIGPGELKYHFLGIGYSPAPFWPGVFIPYWFPTALFAAVASASWIHWPVRFSMRTLLVATTLLALTLGAFFALNR